MEANYTHVDNIPTRIPYEDEKYKWDYDDMGVLCRMDKETEDWEPVEPHCLECGHRPDECECYESESESEDEVPFKDHLAYLEKELSKETDPGRQEYLRRKIALHKKFLEENADWVND